MRYHLFTATPTRNLIITHSQGGNLTFPNFNFVVLPGAQVGDMRPFLPLKVRYDLNVLFIGGNNTQTLARNISHLAAEASEVALRMFVISVPSRDIPDQTRALNRLIESTKDFLWLYRGISRSIYSVEKHIA